VVPDVGQPTRVGIAMQEAALQSQDPSFAYDPTLGHMVAFTSVAHVDVTLTPLPDGAVEFALDALGNPIIDETESLYDPPQVAISTPPVEGEGYYQVTGSRSGLSCVVTFPLPPTLADHITAIAIECS